MQRARQDFEAGLLERRAAAETAARAAAGGMGLDTITARDASDLNRYKAELEAWNAGEAQRQFGGTQDIAQQNLDLRAQELQQQAQLEGRSLDLQQARDLAAKEVQLGNLGISQQDVNLRAQALVQQAQTEGRTLDLQAARQEAETALAREGMVQQTTMQSAQQTFTAAQTALERAQQVDLQASDAASRAALQTAQQTFASAQAALDRVQQSSLQTGEFTQQTTLQKAQVDAQKAQANLDRLQQTALQTGSIQAQKDLQVAQYVQQTAEAALDREMQAAGLYTYDAEGKRTGTIAQGQLDIAKAQMLADTTYRTAELGYRQSGLDAQTAQAKATQDYQTAQMKADDTYRSAMLTEQARGATEADAARAAEQVYRTKQMEKDDTFRTAQLKAQADGQTADASYRMAEVAYRENVLKNQATEAAANRTQELALNTVAVTDPITGQPKIDPATGQPMRELASVALQRGQQAFAQAQAGRDSALQLVAQNNSAANQKTLQDAQNTFAAEQASFDRTQQTALNTVAQLDAQGRPVPDPANPGQFLRQPIQMAMQSAQQAFAAAQANLDRIQQTNLSTVERLDAAGNRIPDPANPGQFLREPTATALLRAQQDFTAAQSVLDRRAREGEFQRDLDFRTWAEEQRLGIDFPDDNTTTVGADGTVHVGANTGTPAGWITGADGRQYYVPEGAVPGTVPFTPNTQAPSGEAMQKWLDANPGQTYPGTPATQPPVTPPSVEPPPPPPPGGDTLPFDPNDQQAVLRWLQQTYTP
jgi:hypothetical protein